MNIFLLAVLGTVDAALDFWCVFLFGLTNLKITKGVRIDTFAAILKQEIAFFDLTKSGDLASRLNSDAGEMGNDLTWFFRFSIESVVRIVSIVSYMLWRSPRLGVCAISVVSEFALFSIHVHCLLLFASADNHLVPRSLSLLPLTK
jgi:ABC-type multidrug transport system fused ATPase/permease subunit